MKKQIKIEQVKEDNSKEVQKYHPKPEEQQRDTEFAQLFKSDQLQRDTEVKRYFNGLTLEQYIDENLKQINGYVEPRSDDPADWQVRYRSLLSRNKLIALLSRIATIRVQMKFKNRYGGDLQRMKIFNSYHRYNRDQDNEDMKQFNQEWDCWVNGTVVTFEKPEKETKTIRILEDYNLETGEATERKKVIQCFKHVSHLVPLQDIWFSNIHEPNEQKQDHIWLRFEFDYQAWYKQYGKMKNANYVQASKGQGEENLVFYREKSIEKDRVEVMICMNVWEDRMIIWSNKICQYDGAMPFGDEYVGKHYPIVVGINEIITTDCIYGKSGADKLRHDTGMFDLFLRKLADRTIITSNPPIFSEGNVDLPESIKLKPGGITQIDNLNGIREFVFSSQPTNDIMNALNIFKSNADSTSISDASQGQARPGITATADAIAEQSTKQLVGLFQFFIENFFKKKALVQAKQELQFISIPPYSEVYDKGEIKEEYPIFTERNVKLADGTRGDLVYRMVATSKELREPIQLDINEELARRRGYSMEYKDLTYDYFDGLEKELEPEVGSAMEMSISLKKAVELEFQKGFMTFFPEIWQQNKVEFAKDYLEVYEKDLDRLLGQGQGQQAQQQMMAQMMGQQGGQPGQPPQGGQPQMLGKPGMPQQQGAQAQMPNSLRQMAQV